MKHAKTFSHLDAAGAFAGLAGRWQDPARGVWTCVVGEEPKWYGGASFTAGLLLEQRDCFPDLFPKMIDLPNLIRFHPFFSFLFICFLE